MFSNCLYVSLSLCFSVCTALSFASLCPKKFFWCACTSSEYLRHIRISRLKTVLLLLKTTSLLVFIGDGAKYFQIWLKFSLGSTVVSKRSNVSKIQNLEKKYPKSITINYVSLIGLYVLPNVVQFGLRPSDVLWVGNASPALLKRAKICLIISNSDRRG